MPATSAFLDAMKTIDPPMSCVAQDAERLASDEEVAGHEDRVVAVPLGQRRLLDRRARRDAGVGDHDVDAAEGLTAARKASRTSSSEVTSPATARPRVAKLSDGLVGAVAVEVEGDDARAGVGQRVDDRAADAAGGAGDERDLPWSSPGGGASESL